jgi:hypothetical protein
MTDRPLTPEQLADRWSITCDQVRRLISIGALPGAFSVAVPSAKRPRWRVPMATVLEYELARAVQPQSTIHRRKYQAAARNGTVKYF